MDPLFLPKTRSPEELQALLAAIISSSDDGIVSKDLNGIVQSWNAGAERIFGYTAEEMIGRSITTLFPPDRMEEEPKILERIRRGERVDHFETIRKRKDGQLIEVSVTISPVRDATGKVVGVSKVARDISSAKRHLREREAVLAREMAARVEAERMGRMKDEFLSTLSHELRTPLNAILGWANILRTPGMANDPEELREGLETIERNARAQSQLIDELLDMSRIINGKLRLDLQPVDVAAVISSAVDSVRPAAEGKKIRIIQLADPKAGPITADPNRLQQVLWNLLTNAVKFTPSGGKVQVVLQRVNSHVEISVSDTGQGIPREFLPRLFTRFSQAETDSARRHGGLGLGLAIVKSIVELHGGTITASSQGPGQGATFNVALPVLVLHDTRESQKVHPQSNPPVVAPSDLPDFAGFRVLVVDDEADARTMIQRVLERCNVTVITAGTSAEALEAVRGHRPNLMLSDIGMPGQDGYELLQQVRMLPPEEGGETPAVAITAFARSEDRRKALMAGFQMHVPKPIEPSELVAIVASHFHAQRRNLGNRR